MSMPTQRAHSTKLSRTLQLREAALLNFCEPVPEQSGRLLQLSRRDWQRLLHWLDTSGLALYFLERIKELQLCETLPPEVFSRLQQNLADSVARTDAMIAESAAIHQSFQQAGLSYVTLKGYSLWPVSVPKPELRSQLDLDFLMSARDAAQARQILESRGYRLHGASGRSLEFKTSNDGPRSLKDLYKAMPQRVVELHIESSVAGDAALLARTENLHFHGVCMPVLPPVDLFLGQGLHVYRHLCGQFSRASHLIEFRRHILFRSNDEIFWKQLRALAERNSRATVALGFVVLLISQVMGDFAPVALTCWTVERLPAPARLWIELYGSQTVYASFPGSKLYLLLQKDLQTRSVSSNRSVRQALLPRRLPQPIDQGKPDESLSVRIRRDRKQVSFTFFRVRFHIFEGVRYLSESIRWRRKLNRRLAATRS